jgi:hypothetical protein
LPPDEVLERVPPGVPRQLWGPGERRERMSPRQIHSPAALALASTDRRHLVPADVSQDLSQAVRPCSTWSLSRCLAIASPAWLQRAALWAPPQTSA